MDVKRTVLKALPPWTPLVYSVLAAATIPWTIYLAETLHTRHVTHHWNIAWVGWNVAIIILLFLNAVFAARASRWIIISATSTAALLVADAWFDIMSSSGIQVYVAIALALVVELPLALLTLSIAIKTLNSFIKVTEQKKA